MDQAIKSALDKYNGIHTDPAKTKNKSSVLGHILCGISIVGVLVASFSFCVRNEYLGADILWSKVMDAKVGEKTVEEMIGLLGEKIHMVFIPDQSIEPINDSGESGSLNTSVITDDASMTDTSFYTEL